MDTVTCSACDAGPMRILKYVSGQACTRKHRDEGERAACCDTGALFLAHAVISRNSFLLIFTARTCAYKCSH